MCRFRLFTCLLIVSFGRILHSDVVVVANKTTTNADFAIGSESGFMDARLSPEKSRAFFTTGKVTMTIGNSRAAVGKLFPTKVLRPNAVYLLKDEEGSIAVNRLDLGGNELTLKPNPNTPTNANFVVPVSLWVDDDQMATRQIWEPKLRKRFDAAAKIVKSHIGVKFKIVRFGTWRSSNRIRVFSGTLYEFIDYVNPKETLAIGFSSQYSSAEKGKVQRIAGTRRPLDRHILVREWTRATSEAERVELLVHELGHFLGACHSTDPRSAMRPQLADLAASDDHYQIRFDPENTLVMALIGEHVRSLQSDANKLTDLRQLSPQTQHRLRQIYSVMATTTPSDPVPTKYLLLLK